MSNKKVLITGGAGFIGSHLAEKLLKNGDEIFVVDDLSTGSLKNIEHLRNKEGFHFIEGSVLNEDLMAKTVEQVDEVYHLAAAVGIKTILDKPLDSLLTNIRGTEIVLQEVAKKGAKVLIASSSEVYGKGDKVPFKESDDRTYGSAYNDRWTYAFSKAVDEFLGLAYWREKKLPIIIVRLFNVIGPRQTGFYGMVAPTFVEQALKGQPITVYGDGKQTRCFTDVDDIADALIKLMAEKQAEGKLFNLGSDIEISVNELAELVKKETNSSSEIKPVPYKEAYPESLEDDNIPIPYEDFRRRVPDITKIKNLIGFEPKITLEESIKKIIEFQKKSL